MGGLALELSCGAPPPIERAANAVEAMLRAMRHRGRDGARLAVVAAPQSTRLTLGYAATWLTDEEVGTEQPHHERGRWVALDGRVDDRAALAFELGIPRTSTDAALALAAVERFGVRALGRMRGELALVAHDERGARTLAAPDRLGAVPLYYRWASSPDGGWRTEPLGDRPARLTVLRVASEKQALFADGPAPSVSFAQLALALAEDYPEREATLYEGIFAIPPGHVLVVERGAARIEPYWRLDPTRVLAIRDPREASAWLRSELTDAIRDRMRARGGRIASTVSGGIDSTTIAALATGIARERGTAPPVLVTVRYPDPLTDETALSADLAQRLGLPLHVHDIPRGPGSFPPSTSLEALYDPFSPLLERMCATARDEGCHAISLGFGGDEIQRNTGYEVDESLQRRELLSAIRWAGPMTERWAVRRLVTTTLRRIAGRPRRPQPFQSSAALTPDARRAVEQARAERRARLERVDVGSATRVLHESLVEGDAAPGALVQGSHLAAQLGVAFLQPFLDVRLIELLLALPLSVRPDPFSLKPLVRRISRDVSPASIAARRHRANFMPFYHRVLSENHDAYAAFLDQPRLERDNVLEPASVRRCMNAAATDASEVRAALNIVTFEGWLAAHERWRPEPTSGLPDPMNASGQTRIVW